MNNPEQIFTITLLVDGAETKILISDSEVPAKSSDEATLTIYAEDSAGQFDEIISKIPRLKDALEEEGSEETITHTEEEFIDLYDLDLSTIIGTNEYSSEYEKWLDTKVTDPFDIYKPEFNNEEKQNIDFQDALAYIDPREALDNL